MEAKLPDFPSQMRGNHSHIHRDQAVEYDVPSMICNFDPSLLLPILFLPPVIGIQVILPLRSEFAHPLILPLSPNLPDQ